MWATHSTTIKEGDLALTIKITMALTVIVLLSGEAFGTAPVNEMVQTTHMPMVQMTFVTKVNPNIEFAGIHGMEVGIH